MMDKRLKQDILRVFAESYSGSGDIDQRNVADGSETSDLAVQDPTNNGGVYFDNNYQNASMPASLDVHNSIYDMADRDKANPHRSDEFSDQPFGEQMVDDNHANNVATASINPPQGLNDQAVAGSGSDFLREAPDSPKTMHDGHPIEELENNQQGINYVVNTDAPHANGPGANMILNDPGIVQKVRDVMDQSPNINKGRNASQLGNGHTINPFVRSARDIKVFEDPHDVPHIPGSKEQIPSEKDKLFHMLQPAPTPRGTPPAFDRFEPKPMADKSMFSINHLDNPRNDAWTDKSGSNVEDVEYASEVGRKHDRATHDFGTKDESGDETNMSANPGRGYSGDEYESMLYSGIQPSAADQTLINYIQKIAELQKEAIGFTSVTPSANTNSGRDLIDEVKDGPGPVPHRDVMLDAKQAPINPDLEENDPTTYRRDQPKRTKVEDDDAQRYYNYSGTGGGYGGEASGDFSGVSPDS